METFAALGHGMLVALQPINLLYATIGVVLGTAVGVLPGIGPAMTVALLLPVTYSMQPTSAFIMFAGIYYGGMYGGSTTSILLNTPGESSSVVTAIEGNLMARAGRGAVGGRAPAPQGRAHHPGRTAVDGTRRLAPVLEAVAAGRRARVPVRRAARRGRGDPDVPVVRHREAAHPAPRGVRQGRH